MKRLPSVFNSSFGIAVAVGSMIGAGILRAPHDVAMQLPNPWLFLGVWVLGGGYALLGANAIAELGAMRPRSGGQYAIARQAFGPFTAFVVGWNDWLSCCGATAAVSIVFAEAVTVLIARPSLTLPVSLAAAIAACLVLWRGSRALNNAQTVASVVKFLGFLALTAACLLWALRHERLADVVPATPATLPSSGLLIALVVALQGVIFAYDGWTGVIYFGEETQNPGRDIPRALFGGVIATMVVYILLNVALIAVLPIQTIAADALPTATAATVVFGASGDTLVRWLVVIALPSGILANLGMASRVSFALGRDTTRLSRLGDANDAGTPGASLALCAVVTLGFLATGTFARVVTLCSVLFVASYVVSFAAVFRLRKVEPDTPRPFRAIWHPYSTGVLLVGSILFLGGTAVASPRDALLAAGLVLLSYPAYRLLR
ncbi:MAG: APC family permease [Phycisphaerae bacterium]|nr:APC family permease [Gemmatimonadaceae bacterium]